MKKGLTGLAGCFIVAFMISACSESITNPLTPGSGLLNSDVTIKNDTLYAVSDTTYFERVALDGLLFTPLRQNLVGVSGNFKAYTAIRFYPTSRDTINVLSAKLTLRLVSWRGDSSGTFGFNVHKILPSWSQTTATWDTLSASNFSDEPTIHGTYPPTSVGADTQSISIALDTALVRSWFVSTNNTNYGILLKPMVSSRLMRGIHAFDFDSSKYWPELEVIARGTSATAVADTTKYQVGADTYGATVTALTTPANRLLTHAGLVYRSRLKFDVSKFPAGVIISSATLSLERDPALSSTNKFTISSQPIVHAGLSSDSTKFESTASAGSVLSGTANTYTFDVRRQVQLWANGNNFGLILRQTDLNEFGTLDAFSFYSREATDPAMRPRIVLKYTTFN